MEFYQKPVVRSRPADEYCAACDAPMTGDEAALNYKLVDKKTTRLLCPACLGRRLELRSEGARYMRTKFYSQYLRRSTKQNKK